MHPASFDESNCYLSAPDGVSSETVAPLSVLRGISENEIPVVISCWKPTREELAEIIRTGRVWLTVLGETMPPVILDGIKPFDGVADE